MSPPRNVGGGIFGICSASAGSTLLGFARAAPTPAEAEASAKNGNSTSVDFFDGQINWGNAHPWDVVSYLIAEGGPCWTDDAGLGSCMTTKKLELPTMWCDPSGTTAPLEQTLVLSVSQTHWESSWTRDALMLGIMSALKKYNKETIQEYREIYFGATTLGPAPVDRGSIPQNSHTNEIFAQHRNKDGAMIAEMRITIELKPPEGSLCDNIGLDSSGMELVGGTIMPMVTTATGAAISGAMVGLMATMGVLKAACKSLEAAMNAVKNETDPAQQPNGNDRNDLLNYMGDITT
ncbi:MAG: hypothetical protein M1831_002781 [Alyxoria varia]|nr:MAG: hypothetical protein M1831_002781 [Alyxoria varia]